MTVIMTIISMITVIMTIISMMTVIMTVIVMITVSMTVIGIMTVIVMITVSMTVFISCVSFLSFVVDIYCYKQSSDVSNIEIEFIKFYWSSIWTIFTIIWYFLWSRSIFVW